MHSVISNVSPSAPQGSIQSNLWMRFANTSSLFAMANVIPGQFLLPDPNGINSKSWPLKSVGLFMNLSVLNFSGSSHEAGSMWIAQALVMTVIPAGISYPLILMSSIDFPGTSKGIGGCSRRVSVITAFKYFICSKSSSFTYNFSPSLQFPADAIQDFATAISGVFLCILIPKLLVMSKISTSASPGIIQSNLRMRFANKS